MRPLAALSDEPVARTVEIGGENSGVLVDYAASGAVVDIDMTWQDEKRRTLFVGGVGVTDCSMKCSAATEEGGQVKRARFLVSVGWTRVPTTRLPNVSLQPSERSGSTLPYFSHISAE